MKNDYFLAVLEPKKYPIAKPTTKPIAKAVISKPALSLGAGLVSTGFWAKEITANSIKRQVYSNDFFMCEGFKGLEDSQI